MNRPEEQSAKEAKTVTAESGTDARSTRRAILRAFAGAPVILTLSSELARAAVSEDNLSRSLDYLCKVPRNDDIFPSDIDPSDCPSPPPGT